MSETDNEVKKAMISVLSESDLETATLKSIMKILEKRLNMDLSDKKELLSNVLNEFIDMKMNDVNINVHEVNMIGHDEWNSSDDEDDTNFMFSQSKRQNDDEEDCDDKVKKKRSKLNILLNIVLLQLFCGMFIFT